MSDYRAMKWKLEEELKQVVKEKLALKQADIDSLVRLMYDAKPNKAAVARALMTSDRATVDRILSRTEARPAPTGFTDADPTQVDIEGATMSYDSGDKQLKVDVRGQMATFDLNFWEDDEVMLVTHDELWNADYSVRNDVVYLLDGMNISNPRESKLALDVARFVKGKL